MEGSHSASQIAKMKNRCRSLCPVLKCPAPLPPCSLLRFLLLALLPLGLTGVPCPGQTLGTHSRLVLGTEANRSASVRLGDLDGDGDLDGVVANGRHWPGQNYVFLNDGTARFTVQRPAGKDRSTTYACELADLDGDGDLDLVTGNDRAPCQVFLNAGNGRFSLQGTFGKISSVRSLTLADIDQDGDPDALVTCRGRANWISLNEGEGRFGETIEFGTASDSTIDVGVGDVNGDGRPDLVLANRDGQPNAWMIQTGRLEFSRPMVFGDPKSQSRAVVLGDFNGDQRLDWAVGNIGQPNRLFLGDGRGGSSQAIPFGDPVGRTYCLAAADMDGDGDLDLVAGNAGQANAIFFNNGKGTAFQREVFADPTAATYGIAVGDLNGDRLPDVVVANSDAINRVYLNRTRPERTQTARPPKTGNSPDGDSKPTPPKKEPDTDQQLAAFQKRAEYRNRDWPAFRGAGARGVAEGFQLPIRWNADQREEKPENILWQTGVPGLGHSSPVVQGERLYLLTAVASEGDAPLQIESGGKPTAADDQGIQEWLMLCIEKTTGRELWRRTLKRGRPRATRHAKATHANTSLSIAGQRIVAFLGSEGLYCYDLQGKLLWQKDLGVINISKYGIGWGFSSSPTVYGDRILIVCDDPEKPYVAALSLADGREIWRTSREGDCERSWGTPLVHVEKGISQVVVNGWPWMVSYRLSDGQEIWRIRGGGDNPVPTPFEAHGLIYLTNAHGGPSPILAVRPGASGDLTAETEQPSDQRNSSSIAWSIRRGGSYMSTPVVYGDQIYVGSAKGIIRSFDAHTGKQLFENRLGTRAGMIASLVAGDRKIYCASENGTVYVLQHGPELKVLSENRMGEPCLATPALSEGTLFIRTTRKLVAIRQAAGSAQDRAPTR